MDTLLCQYFFNVLLYMLWLTQLCIGEWDYTDDIKETLKYVPTNQDPNAPLHRYVFGRSSKKERQVAYFREDMALISHHFHYHCANPFDMPESEKYIDRKGELFIYAHQQLLARYDAERLAAGIGRTVPFHDLRLPIEEGYFPNFPPLTVGIDYPPRGENMILADTEGSLGSHSVDRLERYRDEVLNAIDEGYVINTYNEYISLRNPEGIDLLGSILQSSSYSINYYKYGNMHNSGHDMLGRINDPKGNLGLPAGIMEKATTTSRDPMFYRWHKEISNIAEKHKLYMNPYSSNELWWDKIRFQSISVKGEVTKTENKLTTYTKEIQAYLRAGFDFLSDFASRMQFAIQQHEEFAYHMVVRVNGKHRVQGVVRIFLAPIFDESDEYFSFDEQRSLFMEMDKFKVKLKPGKNILKRRSQDSVISRSMNSTYERLKVVLGVELPIREGHLGCGWPHNLLLPRGTSRGMHFVLFAMITDWEKDKVEDTSDDGFKKHSSYCGIYHERYPDKQNMGFPFDRNFEYNSTLESFMTPSMATNDIIIFHSNQVVPEDGSFDPNYKSWFESTVDTISNFIAENSL